ncbi:MAG: 23S rRNA (uracil(1939)-C(5))-methyltransferase RlmD [Deltaproteobacteria bacterium]|nr:23S rRNA (uracil(1939)-C(5))-methyltransferase RlmD [Deltaproteobacteria bacterium]
MTRLAKSPVAGCPHGGCPGCPLLGVPYSEQLSAKQALVERCFSEALDGSGIALPPILAIRPSPKELGYRATAKLALARRGPSVLLGLYREGSHRVLDVPRCPIHHPLVASGMRALRSLLQRAPYLASPGLGGVGRFRYAAFQVSAFAGRLLAVLVTRSGEEEGLVRSLAARLRERVPELSGVAWNVNPSPGNALFGPEWTLVSGEPFLEERLGEYRFRVSPGSFLQANREQASWAYREVASWLEGGAGQTAWDLYCGVGGIGLHLAPGFERVIGVETSPEAVADAAATAASVGFEHVRFIQAGAAEALPQLEAAGAPAAVVLNPPRKGAERFLLERIRMLGPASVVYLSCNPRTLARDAAVLCAGGGFRIHRIQPMDFLPQTAHVETAVLFCRKNGSQLSVFS